MKYLKEYEIFEQKFAFDSNKESLLKMIANIKKGNNYDFYFKNIIYSVIVGDRAFSDMFDDNIKNEWKNYFMNKCFISDGVWSQRTFNSKYRIGNDMTYNYYITITKEKNNIFNFQLCPNDYLLNTYNGQPCYFRAIYIYFVEKFRNKKSAIYCK